MGASSGGPRALRALAHVLLPRTDREFIIGDLEELYLLRERQLGRGRALSMYLRESLSSVIARRLGRSPRIRGAGKSGASSGAPLKPSRSGGFIPSLAMDVRLALRGLRQRPGFSALVVFTLALGIGATTAVFGLLNQLLLRPLPGIESPERAAYLEFKKPETPDQAGGSISAPDFFELRRETSSSLAGFAAFTRLSNLVRLTPDARPTQVRSNLIAGDYFDLLGVTAMRGRLLAASETTLDSDPSVAVISESLWTRLLGRGEDVVGRMIDVDGRSVTIIGVAGEGFEGALRADPTEMWVPLPARPGGVERARSRESLTFGSNAGALLLRPLPGVSFDEAEAAITESVQQIAKANEASRQALGGRIPTVFPTIGTRPVDRPVTTRVLRTMSAIAVLVLLIACANVANLLLFRALRRRGDVAVRRAMGASAARVGRQELTSTLVLCTLGTVAGLAVAWGVAFTFRGERLLFRSEEFEGMSFDPRLLVFAAGLLLTTCIVAGTLPALLAGRVTLTETLKETTRGDSRRQVLVRAALSALQVALCIPLLVGARLLTRSVDNLYSVDLGMKLDRVVALTMSNVGRQPMERQLQLLEATRAIPGVSAAALEFPGAMWSRVLDEVRLPTQTSEESAQASFNYVTDHWFPIFDIESIAGRTFKKSDLDPGAPATVILTASLAKTIFGRTNVVGERLFVGGGAEETAEIIGVVGDVRMEGPKDAPSETIFLPYTQRVLTEVSVLVRAQPGLTPELSQAMIDAAAATFPELPAPPEPALITSRMDRQLAEEVLLSRLLSLVSLLALLLAAIGIYGVIAFAVASRRKELGIRVALGSSLPRIGALVMAQVAGILVVGVGLGALGAASLSKLLEGKLFEVVRTDPSAYASVAIVLMVATVLACVLPLRSAMKVDPAMTLREE